MTTTPPAEDHADIRDLLKLERVDDHIWFVSLSLSLSCLSLGCRRDRLCWVDARASLRSGDWSRCSLDTVTRNGRKARERSAVILAPPWLASARVRAYVGQICSTHVVKPVFDPSMRPRGVKVPVPGLPRSPSPSSLEFLPKPMLTSGLLLSLPIGCRLVSPLPLEALVACSAARSSPKLSSPSPPLLLPRLASPPSRSSPPSSLFTRFTRTFSFLVRSSPPLLSSHPPLHIPSSPLLPTLASVGAFLNSDRSDLRLTSHFYFSLPPLPIIIIIIPFNPPVSTASSSLPIVYQVNPLRTGRSFRTFSVSPLSSSPSLLCCM
jgi:hypothetical protein